jgi:hypothetical protein
MYLSATLKLLISFPQQVLMTLLFGPAEDFEFSGQTTPAQNDNE